MGEMAIAAPAHDGWLRRVLDVPGVDRATTGRRVLASAIWATAWILPTVALVLTAAYDLPIIRGDPFMTMYLVVAYLYGPVCALLILRRPSSVAVILGCFAIGCGLAAFGYQYELVDTLGHAELPAVGLVGHTLASFWYLGMFLALCTLPWYLTPRAPSRVVRAAAALGWATSVTAFLSRWLWQFPGAARNPLAVSDAGWQRVLVDVWEGASDVAILLALCAAVELAVRARGPADRRIPIAWIAVGQTLMAVTIGSVFFNPRPIALHRIFDYVPFPPLIALLFLPAATLVVLLGDRLGGLDAAVSRVVVWMMLVAVVIAGYVTLHWLARRWFGDGALAAGVVTAAVFAVALEPMRRRLQGHVDRLVYGGAAEPDRFYRGFGARLGRSATGWDAVDDMLDHLAGSLRLGRLEVTAGADTAVAAGSLRNVAITWDTPLLVGTEPIGTLAAAPLPPATALDRRTTEVLRDIAGLIAVTLHLTRLNDELAAARTKVIEVRHAERRMIRRELHDVLGPSLAGVGLGLRAADHLIATRPDEARELLCQLETEVRLRANDVRGLAHVSLPPALDAGDLAGALEELARRFAYAGLQIDVDVPDAAAIDTVRQIAVYHIAAEAITNVVRHANAERATVMVRRDDAGRVVVEVRDDGSGFDDRSGAGVGLISMRERAEELGGTLTAVAAADGQGSIIRAEMPAPGQASRRSSSIASPNDSIR